MPEGPSIVIAREEMLPAIGKKVLAVGGNSREPVADLKGQTLNEIGMWGKHLLFFFSKSTMKIHFLLWGSYSVNEIKENRNIRLSMKFSGKPVTTIYFYASSIKFLEGDVDLLYDWSADVMSVAWDSEKAFQKIISEPREMVCDVLMDQNIFSGVGNIIKNEVLFMMRLHPERLIESLKESQIRELIEMTHAYTWQFYEWKKKFELKKHWLIMRKKICPNCGGPVTREETGKRNRLSHYCPHCQK
jgi:endonuclease-8